ncbi:hypothetical protein [Rubrobacter aplysinae]|uniref:hypothetical protein n=1 Tax=Rubrobacter aplysinae TaxID=909625 RepID=UPI00064B9E88|nr:hypothetical protein [Rubrobacter aplysinae]
MDEGSGRLGRPERSLRRFARTPGSISKGYRNLLIVVGVFLIAISVYSLFFSSGADLIYSIGGALLGLSFVVWFGGGDIEGRLGSLSRFSCLLLWPATILFLATANYMWMGTGYLIFLALVGAAFLLVWWFLKRSSAGS